MDLPIFRVLLIFAIAALIFDTTCAWRRRRRRRRCATHSCTWNWGPCSASCGGGTQNPIKTGTQGACGSCNMPSSSRRCNTGCCPANCHWHSWGSWGACSRSCGSGTQRRNRGKSAESCGGKTCSGVSSETRNCNTGCCPVSCAWGSWSTWQSCSRSCGGGQQSRSRGYSRHPSCGGKKCSGAPTETRSCNQNCCPVNCVWGPWGQWRRCSKTCGGGKQSRSRGYSVASSCGGSACSGKSSEERGCNSQCCPVDCSWASWGNWGGCSASCGGGSQTRNRGISVAMSCGGKVCPGNREEIRSCNQICCPVNCAWTSWDKWGACSASCGGGRQIRERGMNPVERCGGEACVGIPQDERDCNSHCCPTDCIWSNWSKWGACSNSCGGGKRRRHRYVSTPSYCGGTQCLGENQEFQDCNQKCCPINCQWGVWREWGSCTKSCEKGIQTRSRDIDVEAFCEGSQCLGQAKETRFCNDVCCPVHCEWGDWNGWSSCTKTCESGLRHRTRSVLVDAVCNGEECRGLTREEEQCSTQCCPVDCTLSIWTVWSECSHTCGAQGSQTRYRNVTQDVQCGGKQCDSNVLQKRTCNNFCFNGGTLTQTGCTCHEGWKGDCCQEDVNECKSLTCIPNSMCVNSEGSYECVCEHGYTKNEGKCFDVDECHREEHDCHEEAECTNSEGNYACECMSGFTGNGTHCFDIDECAAELLTDESGDDPDYYYSSGKSSNYYAKSPLCHDDAVCINTYGGFHCKCKRGYIGDGVNCEDLNECKVLKHGSKEVGTRETDEQIGEEIQTITPCHTQATCSNFPGSYSCWCKDGFFGDGILCREINECDSGPCQNGGICEDQINMFTCGCQAGYTGDLCEIDVDECEQIHLLEISRSESADRKSESTCDKNATCINTFGSYVCTCDNGFSGNGSSCFDIDECSLAGSGEASSGDDKFSGFFSGASNSVRFDAACSVHAICTNLVGSYSCECNDGYRGDGFHCIEFNECLSNPCQNNGTCINHDSHYTCLCGNGYSGTNCDVDIRECNDGTYDCDTENATCAHTNGSHQCVCKPGFTGDGKTCVDIDECDMGLDRCDPASKTCLNLKGSYRCICQDGYDVVGDECRDRDECSSGEHDCTGFRQVCHNKPGGYECGCTYPMVMKDGKCEERAPSAQTRIRDIAQRDDDSPLDQIFLKPAILASIVLGVILLLASVVFVVKMSRRRMPPDSPSSASVGQYRKKSLTFDEVTENETVF